MLPVFVMGCDGYLRSEPPTVSGLPRWTGTSDPDLLAPVDPPLDLGLTLDEPASPDDPMPDRGRFDDYPPPRGPGEVYFTGSDPVQVGTYLGRGPGEHWAEIRNGTFEPVRIESVELVDAPDPSPFEMLPQPTRADRGSVRWPTCAPGLVVMPRRGCIIPLRYTAADLEDRHAGLRVMFSAGDTRRELRRNVVGTALPVHCWTGLRIEREP